MRKPVSFFPCDTKECRMMKKNSIGNRESKARTEFSKTQYKANITVNGQFCCNSSAQGIIIIQEKHPYKTSFKNGLQTKADSISCKFLLSLRSVRQKSFLNSVKTNTTNAYCSFRLSLLVSAVSHLITE
jgi:hypothetical protein